MSLPGSALSAVTTATGSSLVIRSPGRVTGASVRENTTVSMPGMAPSPIASTTSWVLRPMTAMSNSAYMAAKSMAGSMTIQSKSPLARAMKPSRLTAT